MQGLKSGDAYAGTVQAGWRAYNITSDAKHGIGGWSDDAVAQYLSTGFAEGHGPASGPMADAITNSLRFLTQDDIRAMVTYLRDIPPQAQGPENAPAAPAAVPDGALGAHIFELACAGCHLPNGHGRQSAWAALAGDQSTADPAATNLLQVLAHGSVLRTDKGQVFMHSFAGAYTDPELAAVANYVMARFGGQAGSVTAADIAAAKR
jgi:mono/diheme cytochrome c family protein